MEDSDIIVEVYDAWTHGRYVVTAHYKDFPNITGEGYAQTSLLFDLFGKGMSFQEHLEKATCKAIKNLKSRMKEAEDNEKHSELLNKSVKCYAKKCLGENYGKTE